MPTTLKLPAVPELSALEQAALNVRHRAAIAQLASTDAEERWKLLLAVVAPGEAMQLASERRARELSQGISPGSNESRGRADFR